MMHLSVALPLIIGLVIMALAFDFLNGLHDAANSIATVVSTRLLTPVQAVLFAAFFNFAAYFTFGLKVAETVGKGIINKDVVTPQVIFGALVGAMAWNVITWWRGIPSSSSHALVGGLLGAGIMHAGRGDRVGWPHHDGRDRAVAGSRPDRFDAVLPSHVLGAGLGNRKDGREGVQAAPSGFGCSLFARPRRQ
jgi:hypothetical protein